MISCSPPASGGEHIEFFEKKSNSRCSNNASVSVAITLKNSSIEVSSCRMLALVDTVPTSCVFVCDAFYDTLDHAVRRRGVRHAHRRSTGSSHLHDSCPRFGLMLGLVGVLHKVKPSYLWLTEWLAARLGWAVKNKEYTHGEDNSEVRYLTRVGQVFPARHRAVRRRACWGDESRASEHGPRRRRRVGASRDSLSEFVNATIDFPVKFYITSREVDQDDVVRDHQRRLGDADVDHGPSSSACSTSTLRPTRIRTATSTPRLRPSANTTSSPPFVTLTSSNSTKPAIASWPTSPTSPSWVVFGRFQSDGLSDAERDRPKKTSWNHGWDSSAAVGRRSIAAR